MTFTPDSPLVDEVVASPNFEPRSNGRAVDLILLHYTATPSAKVACDILTDPVSKVSSHYLLDDDGRLTQLVAESERAWHAGQSYWAGETDINSCSIGIEIQNTGHEGGLPEFPEAQMQVLEALLHDILSRHDVPPHRFLGHSDVAPKRKIDPGEKFNWQRLASVGLGLWTDPSPIKGDPGLAKGDEGDKVLALQQDLAKLGYGINTSGTFDTDTEIIVKAFQMHWRPAQVDGRVDYSTHTTLTKILKNL